MAFNKAEGRMGLLLEIVVVQSVLARRLGPEEAAKWTSYFQFWLVPSNQHLGYGMALLYLISTTHLTGPVKPSATSATRCESLDNAPRQSTSRLGLSCSNFSIMSQGLNQDHGRWTRLSSISSSQISSWTEVRLQARAVSIAEMAIGQGPRATAVAGKIPRCGDSIETLTSFLNPRIHTIMRALERYFSIF